MNRVPRNPWLTGIAILFALFLAGCGDDDGRSVGPGLIGIGNEPMVYLTDPLLEVQYTRPGVSGTITATILNDPSTSGDILFDRYLSSPYSIAMGQAFLLFGLDYADTNRPEYRAFLDFPLDGSTGGAVIPSDARITFSRLRVYVGSIEFFETIPVVLDLVEYPLAGLEAFDFDSPPLKTRDRFDIYYEDWDRFVDIEVTTLMQEAQARLLADFQVRFRVQ